MFDHALASAPGEAVAARRILQQDANRRGQGLGIVAGNEAAPPAALEDLGQGAGARKGVPRQALFFFNFKLNIFNLEI